MTLRELIHQYTVRVIPLPDDEGYKAYYEELGEGVKGYGPTHAYAALKLEEVVLDVMSDESIDEFPKPITDLEQGVN